MLWTTFRSQEPEHGQLWAVVQEAFAVPPASAEAMPDAALSYVYRVSLPRDPHQVIVKWQHHVGRSAAEARQLRELRRHALVRVPEVFLCDPEQEVIILEYLPGVRGIDIAPPTPALAEQLADDIVSALLAWHGVRNPSGFGPLDGPYQNRWSEYYRERVLAYHAEICRQTTPELVLSDYVRRVAERSLVEIERILAGADPEPALLHSDYHLANLLVDPATGRLRGVIDPLDAEWGDRGLDLIHWEWPWGERRHLLDLYQRRAALPGDLPLRLAFYEFWYAMQNLARLPWHDARQDQQLAEALDQAMRVFL